MAQSASRSPSFAPDGVPERAVAYGIFVRLDCWCLVWALWRKGIPGGRQTEPDRLDIWTASKRERSPSTIDHRIEAGLLASLHRVAPPASALRGGFNRSMQHIR